MKKRMVSLIVALCMMISLFPVSVFADEGVALCAGQPELTLDSSGRPNGSSGYGWTYSGGVLTLTDGRYNFYSSSTNPSSRPIPADVQIHVTGSAILEDGRFLGPVTNHGTVTGGYFENPFTNYSNVSNASFSGAVSNQSGSIKNCVFSSTGTIASNRGTVQNCLFSSNPQNSGLSVLTLQSENGNSMDATLNGCSLLISDRELYFVGSPEIIFVYTTPASVKITEADGTFWTQTVENGKLTPKAPSLDLVINNDPASKDEGRPITTGAKQRVENGVTTYIGNGWEYDGKTLSLTPDAPTSYDFSKAPLNPANSTIMCYVQVGSNAVLTGGTFAVTVQNDGTIRGGIFNGNPGLSADIYHIDLNGSGSITSVNDSDQVSWTPYVVVTSDSVEQTVTLTADVDITTLNYEDVGTIYNSAYPNGDHKTVTFTMPAEDVTLNLVKPTVTVRNNIDSTEQAPVAAKPGEEVQITAESKRGYTFLYWESDDITLSDKTQNPLTITSMPDHDITLTANYECSKLVISDKGVPTLPSGKDWWYDEDNNTLHLEPTTRTEYDFSREPLNPGGYDIKCKIVGNENTILVGGTFDNTVENNGEITGGTYNDSVKNNGTISGGIYNNSVENNGTIKDGTFNRPVENTENGVIEGGTFNDTVKNDGLIKDGTFNGEVDNSEKGTIDGGTFKDTVKNDGTINDGTFNGKVENTENGTINGGTFKDTVDNDGKITDGTFDGGVNNGENGDISGGTFNGNVDNKGDVTGGDFNGSVDNHPGSTFEPDSDVNKTYTVTIEGGTINGKTTVKAKKGTELTAVLDTNAIPDGMAFDMWSLSSNALTGDPSVDLKAGNMTFLMPAEDVTIRAQYISSAIAEDSPGLSPLGTAVLITAGTAVTGVALWQGYKIGVELYMERELPQGTPIPTNRRELALLLWNTAGKPEPASAELFSDIDAQDLDLQKASHWAQEHQLLGVANEYNLTLFEPESAVNETDVLLGWLRTKKLLRNVETS